MAKIHIKREIQIERNAVEDFLMKARAFYKAHKKVFRYSLIGFFVLVVLVISGIIAGFTMIDNERLRFETILEEYGKKKYENDIDGQKKALEKLTALTDSSWFGFVSRMGYYYVGNLYYENNDLEAAVKYLEKFTSRSSRNMFWELATLKLAVIQADKGQPDRALDLLKIIESGAKESAVIDQMYYLMGNLYSMKKDTVNAKNYYNKLISEFPQSPYSQKAKKRLFMLGAQMKNLEKKAGGSK